MALQNLRESYWRRIKFFILFVLVTSILYIILTKFMLKIPVSDNQKLLSAITGFEQIIEREKQVSEKIKQLSKEIKEMEFDIYQVQRQDDIKREIERIRAIYKENNINSKYKFSLQSATILKIYYDTREQNSALKHNIDLLTENLNKCQANAIQ